MIFTNPDTKKPMKFMLKDYAKNHELQKLIKDNGGDVVKTASQGVIVITSKPNSTKTSIKENFIYDCLFLNTLLDIDIYRADKSSSRDPELPLPFKQERKEVPEESYQVEHKQRR